MSIWVELLLALLLLIGIGMLWGFLQRAFGLDKEEKQRDVGLKKGIDYIGVAVVFLCHDGQGNYITYKRGQSSRDEKGVWDIGAGGVRVGEHLEDTLRREIKEEYKTDVVQIEYLGFRDVHRTLPDGTPTHWVSFDDKVEVVRDAVSPGEETIEEIRWWRTPDEIPTPRMSQLEFFFEKYKESL